MRDRSSSLPNIAVMCLILSLFVLRSGHYGTTVYVTLLLEFWFGVLSVHWCSFECLLILTSKLIFLCKIFAGTESIHAICTSKWICLCKIFAGTESIHAIYTSKLISPWNIFVSTNSGKSQVAPFGSIMVDRILGFISLISLHNLYILFHGTSTFWIKYGMWHKRNTKYMDVVYGRQTIYIWWHMHASNISLIWHKTSLIWSEGVLV